MPLENSDGSVVGMCFTGRNAEDVSKAILQIIITLIIITVIIILAVVVIGLVINKKISAKMREVSTDLTKLADGALDIEVDEDVKEMMK